MIVLNFFWAVILHGYIFLQFVYKLYDDVSFYRGYDNTLK